MINILVILTDSLHHAVALFVSFGSQFLVAFFMSRGLASGSFGLPGIRSDMWRIEGACLLIRSDAVGAP